MTPETLQAVVLQVLRECQELSARPWKSLSPDEKPIDALDGFDSLAGVEATVMIEEKLGCAIALDSVFVSEDGKQALTLRQTCERLATLVAAVNASV